MRGRVGSTPRLRHVFPFPPAFTRSVGPRRSRSRREESARRFAQETSRVNAQGPSREASDHGETTRRQCIRHGCRCDRKSRRDRLAGSRSLLATSHSFSAKSPVAKSTPRRGDRRAMARPRRFTRTARPALQPLVHAGLAVPDGWSMRDRFPIPAIHCVSPQVDEDISHDPRTTDRRFVPEPTGLRRWRSRFSKRKFRPVRAARTHVWSHLGRPPGSSSSTCRSDSVPESTVDHDRRR